MKKSLSLRSRLVWLMTLLVVLQSIALIVALLISQVFLALDAEAFRLFDSTTSSRMQTYNASVGKLVGNMAIQTEQLGARLRQLAEDSGTREDALYLQDDLYDRVADVGTEALLELLSGSDVSAAFFLLNGSNADKEDPAAHSAVYIRNSAPDNAGRDYRNYLLEIGPIAVSQQYQIPTSINWKLDITRAVEELPYYAQPIAAADIYPKAEIERYGYWSSPTDILDDGQRVVSYTMPLLDRSGKGYGVLGVEISLPLLTTSYLPNTDLQYQNSFYAIAPVEDGKIDLSWCIPSGPVAQVYLGRETSLAIKPVAGSDLYETELGGLGSMYCAVQPLTMYSRNSPFYQESWRLIGFVPKEMLHETSTRVRTILGFSIMSTMALCFGAIFILAFGTTRKISGLSKYVRGLSPYADIQFEHTGMKEVDELTAAVEMLNRSVKNASKTTSRILGLTLMPLGGFEISEDNTHVVLTEYIYTLLKIPEGTQVSKDEWKKIYAKLVRHPAQNYDDIYQYDGDEPIQWLRIITTPTESGTAGIILDVTKDIEEHRRLAHELDYDALTHLYSRTAFKREAHRLIQTAPEKIGAMLFVDLDNLKYMNDTFGHDMGDRLLIHAGELFRRFEAYGGAVSRISGDEFAMYLHGFSTKEEALEIVHKQYAEFENSLLHTPDGKKQRIRFSSGIAFYPEDSDNVTDLLKLSDYAMYEAKHSKKGTLLTFDNASYQEHAYLLDNREAINRLLDDELIRFAFQPIIDLQTGQVYAYEALMRPVLENFKSPLEILSVASSQSKLGQLERMVMMQAMQSVKDSVSELEGVKVFINSIPSQTLSQEDYLMLERRFGGIFDKIVIEITEAENNSPEQMQSKLAFFRRNGIKIAVDDFGSGYSNELRILSMNPDVIKIDIALVSGIDTDTDKQKLVSNLVSFCHPKGILLIAEGVERREELAKLASMGLRYAQGYYVGHPNTQILPIRQEIQREVLGLREA